MTTYLIPLDLLFTSKARSSEPLQTVNLHVLVPCEYFMPFACEQCLHKGVAGRYLDLALAAGSLMVSTRLETSEAHGLMFGSAFIAFENRIAAASARNAGHIDQLPIDALSRSEWMMKKYRELIEQDVPYSNGLPPPDHYLDQPPSPPGSPRNGRAQPVVYERSSWTREGDAGRQGRQGRGPPPYGPPRSRAPDTSPRRGPPRHEPPRHEPPRHFPGDERVLSTAPRPVYHDELARVPVDRAPVQPYPANGTSNREPIGWKDGRDYPPPGYDRERMSPGYSHPPVVPADPRYDPIPGRPREYDDRAGRPSPREASRYSPYPPRSPAAPHYPPPPRERVPASPGYPPPLPVDVRMDDGPRRERAPSADSRRMSARGMEAPIVPLTKPLSATAPSEEALNTLKFMRDMQCQPGQYHIAAEKEPRFADAEVITLEGIKGSSCLFWTFGASPPGSVVDSGRSWPFLFSCLVDRAGN